MENNMVICLKASFGYILIWLGSFMAGQYNFWILFLIDEHYSVTILSVLLQ